MSSLRISHHSRAIGAPTPGAEKPEASDDGAGFAAALDAAGGALKQAATLFGGGAGDAPDGSAAPHKPADNRNKTDALDATLLVGTDALGTPTVSPTPHKRGTDHSASGDSALSPAVSGALVPGALAAAATALSGSGAGSTATGDGDYPAVAAAGGSRVPVAVGVAAAPDVILTTGAGPLVPDAAANRFPIAANGALSASAHPERTPQAAADPGADATIAAPQVSAPAPGANPTQPGPVAVPTGSANGWMLPADALVVSPDVSQTLAPAEPVSTKAPVLGATSTPPALLSGLAQSVAPLASGQPATGYGGDAFGDMRDRFAPVASTSASGDVAPLAAANGPDSTTALAGASGAAPAAATGPMDAGAIADQVAGHLIRMVSSGSHDMVMRLHPPELGDLTVRVAVNGRDVSAWFASPQPQVQTAISAAMGQLQADLGNAGYNLNNSWVGGDGSDGRQQAMNSPAPIAAPLSAAPAALSAVAVSRPAASGLNIYV